MRLTLLGLAALLCTPLALPASAGSIFDQIQNEEAPGSAIGIEIGGGQVEIGRERNLNAPPAPLTPPVMQEQFTPSPVQVEGQALDVPNDPDSPAAADPVDAELPGEGPEDLSGPGDEDPLPE